MNISQLQQTVNKKFKDFYNTLKHNYSIDTHKFDQNSNSHGIFTIRKFMGVNEQLEEVIVELQKIEKPEGSEMSKIYDDALQLKNMFESNFFEKCKVIYVDFQLIFHKAIENNLSVADLQLQYDETYAFCDTLNTNYFLKDATSSFLQTIKKQFDTFDDIFKGYQMYKKFDELGDIAPEREQEFIEQFQQNGINYKKILTSNKLFDTKLLINKLDENQLKILQYLQAYYEQTNNYFKFAILFNRYYFVNLFSDEKSKILKCVNKFYKMLLSVDESVFYGICDLMLSPLILETFKSHVESLKNKFLMTDMVNGGGIDILEQVCKSIDQHYTVNIDKCLEHFNVFGKMRKLDFQTFCCNIVNVIILLHYSYSKENNGSTDEIIEIITQLIGLLVKDVQIFSLNDVVKFHQHMLQILNNENVNKENKLLTYENKSITFFANIANVIRNESQANTFDTVDWESNLDDLNENTHIIYLDDGLYSGGQCATFIERFILAFWRLPEVSKTTIKKNRQLNFADYSSFDKLNAARKYSLDIVYYAISDKFAHTMAFNIQSLNRESIIMSHYERSSNQQYNVLRFCYLYVTTNVLLKVNLFFKKEIKILNYVNNTTSRLYIPEFGNKNSYNTKKNVNLALFTYKLPDRISIPQVLRECFINTMFANKDDNVLFKPSLTADDLQDKFNGNKAFYKFTEALPYIESLKNAKYLQNAEHIEQLLQGYVNADISDSESIVADHNKTNMQTGELLESEETKNNGDNKSDIETNISNPVLNVADHDETNIRAEGLSESEKTNNDDGNKSNVGENMGVSDSNLAVDNGETNVHTGQFLESEDTNNNKDNVGGFLRRKRNSKKSIKNVKTNRQCVKTHTHMCKTKTKKYPKHITKKNKVKHHFCKLLSTLKR